jgi:hypothetical protein
VAVLHKPPHDDAWRDTNFRDSVLDGLSSHGVKLVPISGVHAKTVMIDDHIVYEGSLNWASQIESYEHIMRIDDRNIAALEERMMQIPQIVDAFGTDGTRCPKCDGPLMVVNQRKQSRNYDTQPLKLGCINRETSKVLRWVPTGRRPTRSLPQAACMRARRDHVPALLEDREALELGVHPPGMQLLPLEERRHYPNMSPQMIEVPRIAGWGLAKYPRTEVPFRVATSL